MHNERSSVMISGLVLAVLLAFPRSSGAGMNTIDTAQLHAMIVDNAYRLEGGRQQHFTVIDARVGDEYDEAHIFSAISVPTQDFEKLTDRLPTDKDTILVVYDNGVNNEAIGRWAEKAAALGYVNIVVYSEGFPLWKKSKMPVAPLENTP